MIIRREEPRDVAAIRFVNEQAFDGTAEANAIDGLRERGAATLSLVAVIADRVVGHLLFTPIEITAPDRLRYCGKRAATPRRPTPRWNSPSMPSAFIAR